MGYRQNIIISSVLTDELRCRIEQSALLQWSFLRFPRERSEYSSRLLLALPELTDYLFKEDAEYEARLEENFKVADELSAWSGQFPGITFAYIESDCFGGTCLYSGSVCRAEQALEEFNPDEGSLGKLLEHVEIKLPFSKKFIPFTRGYFEGRCSGLAK